MGAIARSATHSAKHCSPGHAGVYAYSPDGVIQSLGVPNWYRTTLLYTYWFFCQVPKYRLIFRYLLPRALANCICIQIRRSQELRKQASAIPDSLEFVSKLPFGSLYSEVQIKAILKSFVSNSSTLLFLSLRSVVQLPYLKRGLVVLKAHEAIPK